MWEMFKDNQKKNLVKTNSSKMREVHIPTARISVLQTLHF
jgi:hypothetical protein